MRKEHKTTPAIKSGVLYTNDSYTGIRIGSSDWFDWLELGRTFYYGVTFRCEARRNGRFWYAYKRKAGKLRKKYVGRSDALTLDHLTAIVNEF